MDSETLPYIATAAAVGATALYLISSQVKGKVRTTWTPSTPDELSAYASGTRHWNVDPDGEVPPKIAKSGIASTPGRCVHEVFQEAVKNHGGRVALRWESAPGEWKTWTWQQYYDSCCLAARGFMHLGLQPFERFFANNGAILAGGKAAGIYTTNGPEACQYITEHSAARVVVVEDEKQLKKFEEAVIVYRPSGPVDKSTKHGQILSWESFMKLADKTPEDALQARMRAQRPGMCCLLIYTSGTTGPPKAVMISHDNICFTAITLLERLGSNYGTDPSNPERGVSYLPLSHIAAQMCDIWAPIYVAGTCASWGEVYFARPDALRGTLVNTLKAARPTMFFGVPRVWEKMMEGMKESGKNNSGMKKKLVGWARGVGGAYQANRQTGGSGVVPIGFAVANKIVFSKVRAALGLDACKIQFTGAAPMAREVFEFFNALNLPIYELYGMSECTGPQTVTHDGGYLVGSTGQSLKGTEIKIDHVPSRDKPGEGEICYRGRHIMMGYMKQPEKTRETIDPEGFLHSGDVGRVDENGFLFITGRIKELIITAGGENIAPVPIENAIKQFCPGLSNVMMVGDKRKFNVCLVTLKTKPDAQGMPSDNELFAEATTVSSAKTVAEAREDKTWLDYIHGGISQYNEKIAVSNAAKIQKFAILPHDFSIAYELTPTLKLKREATAAKYAEVIEKLYSV